MEPRWRVEVQEYGKMQKIYDVRDMMRHRVKEGEMIFKGSTHEHDWLIHTDGLKQWWTPKSQEFLGELGFRDRQVRLLGDTALGSGN